MDEAGIADGSLVLVKQQEVAASGEVVVALVDDEVLQMTGSSLALWLNCPLNNWRLMEVFARLFGHQDKGPTPNGR
jgi:hypothetical protein